MHRTEHRLKGDRASPLNHDLRELSEKAALAEVYLDLARRTKAELFNYQDRVDRERRQWTQAALIDFVRDILPVLDAISCAQSDNPNIAEGLRKIEQDFIRILARYHVAPIDTGHATFDPALHDAVALEETRRFPPNSIVEELRRGWMMNGKVVRSASVRVARRPGEGLAEGDETATL